MALTSEQHQFYHDNGYLVLERLIPSGTLRELRVAVEGLRNTACSMTQSDAVFDLGPGHSAETPRLRRIKDPVFRYNAFDGLMRSDLLIDIVAELLGGTARFDHSKLNFKPADGTAAIEWHQDWAFYPHTNDDLLAVGVMLEDCNAKNGPLNVIPGSHKGPVHNHHQNGIFVGEIATKSLSGQLDRAVALTAPAGSISIHHVRTLHASSDNQSDRDRPLLLYSYSAVDAFPVFQAYDLDEYNGRILRGAPTLVPRATDVPMRLPLPRYAHADSIFDNQAGMNVA